MGKATVFLVGLAVILAILFGVASTAFAHKGDKGFFHLAHKNVAQKVSTLVRQGAGPALNLQVESGPPLRVDSDAKVANLNADKLDGLDSSELAQGRVSISGTSAQSFGAIVQHFEGFGNYSVGFRRVVTAPEKANPPSK